MHSYSIDDNKIRMWIITKFILGIVITICIGAGVLNYDLHKTVSLIMKYTPIIFLGIYFVFDRYLWKIPIIAQYHKVPYLAGEWRGGYQSRRYDENEKKLINKNGEVNFVIKQTWSKIAIISHHDESNSDSVLAGIFVNEISEPILRYEYKNQPKSLDIRLGIHYGCSNLRYKKENDTLEGDYFNDINRRTQGNVVYKRVNSKKRS